MLDLTGQGLGNAAHGMTQTREYATWLGMIHRCMNPRHIAYKNYGGRGIKVCRRWYLFKNFYVDMGKRPKGKSIDRIDNDGNYEPSNCRWATSHEQRINSRPASCGPAKQQWFFACFGPTGERHKSNNQRAFAKQYGLNHSRISACLLKKEKAHKGWTFGFLT